MSSGVFTNLQRVEFVKGWLTGGTDPADGSVECGDNTLFPIEVNLDQMAEIMYRVKDAYFTGGEISGTIFTVPATITFPTTGTANRSKFFSSDTYTRRGYTSPSTLTYYGSGYDAGIGANYYDISDDERGIYLANHWANGSSLVNPFRYYAIVDDDTLPSPTDGFMLANGVAYGMIQVITGERVAIIKTDVANSDVASSNRYFLEIRVSYEDVAGSAFIAGDTYISGSYAYACDYIIRLASGDVSCPFYIGDELNDPTGTDIIHEAVEWWPYAKGNPSAPVWNAATGALL